MLAYHARRPPLSFAALFLFAVAVALLSIPVFPMGPPVVSSATGTASAGSSHLLGTTAGESLLARASASLSAGAGPASGAPMSCTFGSALSVSCNGAAAYPSATLPQWSHPGPRMPGPRELAASASLPAGQGVLLFGGFSVWTGNTYDSDTWLYNGGVWTELAPSTAPAGRAQASMTYDARDHEVVLFGGYSYWGPVSADWRDYGDTWTFASGVWTNITASLTTAPNARFGAAMTYDNSSGAQYVLLFGGATNPSGPSMTKNDTWEFQGNAWKNVSASVVSTPDPRYGASMAYDVYDNEVVMFGGIGSSYDLTDTWLFSGGTWKIQIYECQFTLSSPCVEGGSMVYDASLGEVILAGGSNGSLSSAQNTTWAWRLGGWSAVNVAQGPVPLSWGSLAYSASDGTIVFFGGGAQLFGGTLLGDTWLYKGGAWSPALAPPYRQGGTMTFDAADGYVLLFSGALQVGLGYGDTWEYAGDGNWTELHPSVSPSARSDSVMAYDAADREVILYGGDRDSGSYVVLNDTWAFAAGKWTDLSASLATNPGHLAVASMVYDPVDGYLVLFGGQGPCMFTCQSTWTFVHNVWTPLNIPAPPPGREFAGMAWDSGDQEIVLFGGMNYSISGFTSLGDTWTFAGGSWTYRAIPGPSARYEAMMTADEVGGGVLMFGGSGSLGVPDYEGDTWSFGGNVWTNLTSSLTYSPGGWWDAMAADDGGNGLILFGGYSLASGWVAQTWILSYPITMLTTSATPAGAGTVTPASESVVVGSTVTVTGHASPGYHFATWTGSGSGSYSGGANPTTVAMNGPISEMATFAANATVVSVAISPASPQIVPGATVQLTAAASCAPSVCSSGIQYSWSTTNSLGSLNAVTGSTVTFTAGSAVGGATVFANATSGAQTIQSGPDLVTIAWAPVLTGVSVTPTTSSLAPGAAQSFTATAACTPSPCGTALTYTWSLSTNLGSLSSTTGSTTVYTAGSSNGSVTLTVRASLNGTSKSSIAQVTVGTNAGGSSGGAGLLGLPGIEGYLLIGAILVAASVVALVAVRRRRPPAASASPPTTPPPPPS